MMNSFICWIGGKKLLRKEIIAQFPENVERYVEVFGGAGWVLFGKKISKLEVFNDINSELINLYRVIKYHPTALQEELDFMFTSREQFFNYRDKNLKGMTDIQRAARYFYIIKASFGGDKTSFGCARKNIADSKIYLTEVAERLRNVVIENKDFEALIKTYDRENTLFYCDPPYVGTEGYYQTGFGEKQYRALSERLSAIKGKFLLSYNDCELVRELYKDYTIIEVERNHNLKAKTGKSERYKEVLIKNY